MTDSTKISGQETKDLYVTHVFINALRAAYQGLYIYFSVTGQLSGADTSEEMEETGRQLDLIHRWWAAFRERKPMSGIGHSPQLHGDCAIAWDMLQAMRQRYSAMSEVLGSSQHLNGLLSNPEVLHLRVAVYCEHAYARQQYIDGLHEYGKVTGNEEVIGVYARHMASCQEEVRRVNACLAEVLEAGLELSQDQIREIFDETLTLSVMLSQKVADLQEIFGLHQGGFGFQQAGITPAKVEDWKFYEFTPATACQWHLAGFDARTAYAWKFIGMSGPLEAQTYQLRQFDINTALLWWGRGINGRTAAAWRNSGYTIDQAVEFREKGIGHPSLVEHAYAE